MAGTLLSWTICCVSYLINEAGEFSLTAENSSMGNRRWGVVDLRLQIYTMRCLHSLTVCGDATGSALPFPLHSFTVCALRDAQCNHISIGRRFLISFQISSIRTPHKSHRSLDHHPSMMHAVFSCLLHASSTRLWQFHFLMSSI
jgi:hypothetical protein